MTLELSNRRYSRHKARKTMNGFYYNNLPRYLIIHHKDHNPLNNDLSNLELMDKSRHMSYHMKLYWEKQSENLLQILDSLLTVYNTD